MSDWANFSVERMAAEGVSSRIRTVWARRHRSPLRLARHMSAWIRCSCGKLNHQNLFADEKLCRVIQDELLSPNDCKSNCIFLASGVIGRSQ